MFELLSGRAPFGGLLSSSQLMAKIVKEDLDDIQSLNGTVPDSVAAVIQRATHKDPKQRYETMAAMADALDRIIRTEIGGRGDVKTFMRILYQEDVGKPAPAPRRSPPRRRVERRPARRDTERVDPAQLLKNAIPSQAQPLETTPSRVRPVTGKDKELKAAASRRESRKTTALILAGVSILGAVAGTFYVVLTTRAELGMEDLDPSAFIETGISVRCDSGLVYLDGVEMGQCPTAASQTSVGRYKLEIVDGNARIERTVNVGEGQLINIDTRGE
ncbi:MAG: hypothetical protein AAFX94_13340 [Myxococcota bacterium]